MSKAISTLLVTAAAWSLSSIALAENRGVRLVWDRPIGSLCPSRAVLESDVEQITGQHIFTDDASARVIVRGVIDDDASGARVAIEATRVDGVWLGARTLSAPSGRCASLRDAIALVLTLLVERERELAAPAEPITGPRFGLGASASLLSTPLPRATVSGGPSLSLELGSLLRLRADAAYFWPVTIETQRGVGARMHAWSVALRACARLAGESSVLALRVCGGAELGALIATPLSLQGPARQTRLLAHGILDLRLERQLGSFGLVDIAIGPLISLSRPSFSYVRSDGERMPVYRPNLGGIILQVSFITLGW